MNTDSSVSEIVSERTTETTQRVNALIAIRESTDTAEIARAVVSEDGMEREFVMSNPLLSENQCRYLWLRQEGEGSSARNIIVSHPNFPTDMLYELALDPRAGSILREIIADHPNSTEEIQVIVALRFGEPDRYSYGSI